jgi:gas vesicle protein GvpG
MFLLDSLLIDGISWTLRTVTTAAEAEMNDDTALREQLLAAEMQRELGEITDEEFADMERDLLTRIREIKERREGGSDALEFAAGTPIETDAESRFQIEATVSGDFHQPADAPHTTIVEQVPPTHGIVGTESGQVERVLDIEPVGAVTIGEPALPLPTRKPTRTKIRRSSQRKTRTVRTTRSTRTSKIR